MRLVIASLLVSVGLAHADVECLDADLNPNGAWSSVVVNSIATKACTGAARPVYYRVSRGTTNTDTQARNELNQVAEDAWLGDTIMLKAGDVWNIPVEAPWYITRRENGTGYLTITTTEYAKLPAEGTRITPAHYSGGVREYLRHPVARQRIGRRAHKNTRPVFSAGARFFSTGE
jgi:hypothetical protein